MASGIVFSVWEASIVKATDHAVLASIRKRADRDRLGYNGKAFVSKDPKVEIVEDRQWLLEYIEQFDLDAISLAIGTNEFLDPPDGGGPSLAEQIRRMKEQLDLLRVRADVNVCACCKNTFVQPLVCTTCGAQRLYDHTMHSIIAERTRAQYLLMEMMKAYERRVRSDCKSQEEIDKRPWECAEYLIAAEFLMRTLPEESLSGGNPGEPKACTPAEERGIVGATGAGQHPDGNPESTGDSADRRSPDGTERTPSPDESNRHLTALRSALADAAGIITLVTDVKPISEWQRDLVRRSEAWISSYYKNCINL